MWWIVSVDVVILPCNHGLRLLWLQQLGTSELTPLKPSCIDLNIITYRGAVNMWPEKRQGCQNVGTERKTDTVMMRRVKQTEKKVRFSQKFPLIIHTPTHSSAQSCYKGHFCGLKIKIVRVTAPSWYVTSPAVPAAGDLLSQHISGTKWLLAALFSYISSPPRPLLCLTSLCSHFFFLVLFVSFQKMILSFSSFLFLVSPRPPLLYLHASSLLETNAQFSVFIYTNFPSADIPDVHCNPSSSSSPSSYPNLLQPPKSTSCNH